MHTILKFLFTLAIITFFTTSYADTQRGIRNYQAIMSGQIKIEELNPQELEEVLTVHNAIKNKTNESACIDAIESQIDGEFKGWSGETIFKLTNGQIWQQSSYAYTYSYSYRPEVLIYPASGGCKMKVDGVSGSISVRRLK